MVWVDHLLESGAGYIFVRLSCAPSTRPTHTYSSLNLPFAAVGAWVLLLVESDEEEKTEDAAGGGGQNNQLGGLAELLKETDPQSAAGG